jgi:hypothetical protein
MKQRKVVLTEDEMPRQWYNILADIKIYLIIWITLYHVIWGEISVVSIINKLPPSVGHVAVKSGRR